MEVSLKIYVPSSKNPSTQLCLDSALVAEADVMIMEKAGGITAAYPISASGKADLETLKLRAHYQPEYHNSFYPIPFSLGNAVAFLVKRFKVEYINPVQSSELKPTFSVGDLVICGSLYGNEVHAVVDVHQLSGVEKGFALHSQRVTIRDHNGYLPSMSGHLLVKIFWFLSTAVSQETAIFMQMRYN